MRHSISTWTKWMCLAVSLPWLAVTVQAGAPQPAPPQPIAGPVHAPSEALDFGLLTLSSSLSYFTGQTVRIAVARVDEVLSPRVFTVEPANMPRSQNWRMDSRALVVLATPTSTPLQRGAILEIVGKPWSLHEARLKGDQAALADLGKRHARRFQYKPVIYADLVRTPGGVELYGAR